MPDLTGAAEYTKFWLKIDHRIFPGWDNDRVEGIQAAGQKYKVGVGGVSCARERGQFPLRIITHQLLAEYLARVSVAQGGFAK